MASHNSKSSTRQMVRTQQRGHLQRSTLIALVVVAVMGLILSQAPRFPAIHENLHNNFIEWTHAKGFAIQRVDVMGRKKVSGDFIMQSLQIKRGMPILNYDPKAAQERLSVNPWFKTVNVERRLPDTVLIRVQERVPAARWQVDGKLALIDGEGVALPADRPEEYSHLPIIIGQDARHQLVNLMTLLNAQPEIAKDLTSATWIGDRRWDLMLQGNLLIRLPADNPELALAHLASLNEKQNLLARDVTSIDLRLPGQAVLQPTIRANALIERPNFSDTPGTSKNNI